MGSALEISAGFGSQEPGARSRGRQKDGSGGALRADPQAPAERDVLSNASFLNPEVASVYHKLRMPQDTLRLSHRPGRRAYLLIGLFALALVLFPFLFWYSTWFGRKLSDSDLDAYFADRSKPRHIQHALVQLGERASHGQNSARWYPSVVASAASANLEIRQTAAWIMGQDRAYQPFHELEQLKR